MESLSGTPRGVKGGSWLTVTEKTEGSLEKEQGIQDIQSLVHAKLPEVRGLRSSLRRALRQFLGKNHRGPGQSGQTLPSRCGKSMRRTLCTVLVLDSL